MDPNGKESDCEILSEIVSGAEILRESEVSRKEEESTNYKQGETDRKSYLIRREMLRVVKKLKLG